MNRTLGLFALVALHVSCNDCTSESEYISHLNNVRNCYYRIETSDRPLTASQMDSVLHESVLFLEETSGLKNHMGSGWMLGYKNPADYLADSAQYANWYYTNCE